MTSNTAEIHRLFPFNPVQADEMFEGTTNNPEAQEARDGDFVISAEDMDAIHDVEDEARIALISTQVTNMVVQMLDASGYENPLVTDADVDMCLIAEAVVSLLQKYNDKTHPLQEIAAKTIVVDDESPLAYSFDWRGLDVEYELTMYPEDEGC